MSDASRSTPSVTHSTLVSFDARDAAAPPRVDAFVGTTLRGDSWHYDPSDTTVFLFVKDSCDGCHEMIEAAADPIGQNLAAGETVVIAARAVPSTKLRESLDHCDPSVIVLVDEAPFAAFGVHSAPFFVVASQGVVVSEGVPFDVTHLVSLLDRARRGDPVIEVPRLGGPLS